MPSSKDPMGVTKFFMESFIKGKLDENKDKNFVDRIINKDKYPVIKNKDGSHSTHLMTYSEVDDKVIAYPEIVMVKGKLKKLPPSKALEYALDKNEYISFDTTEDAEIFTKNYKNVWEK